MIRKLIFNFIFIGLCFTYLNGQNFEGIIIYERTAGANIAIETYYFGKNKLRIDMRFLFDNYHQDYVTIYDLENNTNHYYSDSGIEPFRKINFSGSSIETLNIKGEKIDTFMGYEVYPVYLEYKDLGILTSSLRNQTRLHAKDLKFEIPEERGLDYTMVISGDDGIALFLQENVYYNDPQIQALVDPVAYQRRAIRVIPMSLPEDLFDYEVLLTSVENVDE